MDFGFKRIVVLALLVSGLIVSEKACFANDTEIFAETDYEALGIDLDQEVVIDPATLPNITEARPILVSEDPRPKVGQGSFQIVGKGIRDRRTGDSIVILCVGEMDAVKNVRKCDQIRHAYFKADLSDAYFFGKTYQVTNGVEPSGQQIRTTLREIKKAFRKEKKKTLPAKYNLLFRATFWTTVGVMVLIPGAGYVAGAVGMTLMGLQAPAVLFNPAIMTGAGNTTEIMMDQKGWNWAEHSRVMKHSRFRFYQKLAESSAA